MSRPETRVVNGPFGPRTVSNNPIGPRRASDPGIFGGTPPTPPPVKRPTGRVLWRKFVYDYDFKIGYGWPVKVCIDFTFDDVAGLETISNFPHKQRRSFAKHLLEKYEAEEYHRLSPQDIKNPFARKLDDLFENAMQAYWTRGPTRTTLILTGFRQKISTWFTCKTSSTTVCRVLQYVDLGCGFRHISKSENQIKSYLGTLDAERSTEDAIPAEL